MLSKVWVPHRLDRAISLIHSRGSCLVTNWTCWKVIGLVFGFVLHWMCTQCQHQKFRGKLEMLMEVFIGCGMRMQLNGFEVNVAIVRWQEHRSLLESCSSKNRQTLLQTKNCTKWFEVCDQIELSLIEILMERFNSKYQCKSLFFQLGIKFFLH